jgi:putative lipoprotein
MIRLITIITALSWIAACQTQTVEDGAAVPTGFGETGAGGMEAAGSGGASQEAELVSLVGSLIYHQRIALPVDAVVRISIREDDAMQPASEPLKAERFALNGRQVPIPFEIELEKDIAANTGALRIDVQILDGEDRVLWHNGEDGVVDIARDGTNIGVILLQPTSASVVSLSDLTGREWQVIRVNGQPINSSPPPTINFETDGHINGNASCNAYTGSYKVNAGKLTVAPLAMTRKACVPPLMQQEQTLISVLETATGMQLDDNGELTLESGDSGSIVAR